MESETRKWKLSFLYLLFVSAILFLIHFMISDKLLLGKEIVRIKRNAVLPLRFRSDGTFKILQVADVHFGNGAVTSCRDVLESEFEYCSDLNSTMFLRRLIEAEKPDFVAFTGDNIFGPSATDAAESLFKVFGPVIESKLAWAAVLGNHDQESTMTREELMSFISLMDYSLSRASPLVNNNDPAKGQSTSTIDGYGNYNLEVHGAPGSHLANNSILNLYFLDSGDRATVQGIRTYGWIKQSQLDWLSGVSEGYQDMKKDISNSYSTSSVSNFLSKPPALTFFHIPIPEVRQLYRDIVGKLQEGVACSIVNSGLLRTLVSMGDVKAVFIGHDHKNDFCGELDGIWFCYGGGFGYHGYGRAGWPRRARVIFAELEKGDSAWMGVDRIKTWKRLDDEKLTKIDEQILWE